MSQVLIRIFYGIESKPVQMTLQGSSLGSFLYKQDGTIYVTENMEQRQVLLVLCCRIEASNPFPFVQNGSIPMDFYEMHYA